MSCRQYSHTNCSISHRTLLSIYDFCNSRFEKMEFSATFIVCGLMAIVILRLLWRRAYNWFYYTYPPGPRGWPLVGNMFSINVNHIYDNVWDHKKKYGPISYINLAGNDFVFLNTAEAVREAFLYSENKMAFSGRIKSFIPKYCLPNDFAVATYSKKYVQLRKLLHTSILHGNIESRERIFATDLEHLKKDLAAMIGKPFDMYRYLWQSFGNAHFSLISGERYEFDHDIHKLITKLEKLLLKFSIPSNIVTLTLFPVTRHIPLGPGKVFQDMQKTLDDIFRHLRRSVENSEPKSEGFLPDLLREQLTNEWLSDETAKDAVLDIIIAGIPAVSRTSYALLLALLHNPTIQEGIQAEIDAVVGSKRAPTLDDQSRMPYTHAVIIESLRFGTMLMLSAQRETIDDVTLLGFHLKKGTAVVWNGWFIHHDQDVWEEPWQFKPERFLDEQGQLLPSDHPTRRDVIAFGMGNRRCAGDTFAMEQIFLMVTHLCQTFTFYNDHMELVTGLDPRGYVLTSSLCPHPYEVQVAMRKKP